jgi:hypothetical protein
MVARVLVWEVYPDKGPWRRFRSFEEAERFARRIVAASGADRFAISAEICGPGECASVRLDGNNRVWTEFPGPLP